MNRRPTLGLLLRFGLVGGLATLTYLATALALASWTDIGAMWGNLAANATGVAASYVGHHSFTYKLRGRHDFYLPRFIVVTALLVASSSLLTYAATAWLSLSAEQAALVVTVVYPPLSFALQHFLTFAGMA